MFEALAETAEWSLMCAVFDVELTTAVIRRSSATIPSCSRKCLDMDADLDLIADEDTILLVTACYSTLVLVVVVQNPKEEQRPASVCCY